MIVNNSNFSEIFSSKDGKALKEIIKKTVATTREGVLAVSKNQKNINIQEAINEMFKDILNNPKSKETVLNLLKNSSGFKNLGNFTGDLKSLSSLLKEVGGFKKEQAQIKDFLKEIKNIDGKNLKSQISKSGILLESKLSSDVRSQDKFVNLKETLVKVKQDIIANKLPNPKKTLQTIETVLLSKKPSKNILQTELKNIESFLKNTLEKLSSMQTNKQALKDISSLRLLQKELPLLESKAKNGALLPKEKESFIQKTKNLLLQIKQEVSVNPAFSQSKQISKIVDTILSQKEFFPNVFLPQDKQTASLQKLLTQLTDNIKKALSQKDQGALMLQDIRLKTLNTAKEFQNAVSDFKMFVSATGKKEMPVKSEIINDMKNTLLQIAENLPSKSDETNPQIIKTIKQVDNLLMQIDYYQLLSYATSSNSLYLPYLWDQLKDGSLVFKKADEDKFSCEIRLSLEKYGDLNIMLLMYNDNHLNISIYAQKKELENKIKDNIEKLKKSMNLAGAIPVKITFLEIDKVKKKSAKTNSYKNNDEANFGVNVKI